MNYHATKKSKLTATVRYIDQEAPPELRQRALRIYAQWLIDAWKRQREMKRANEVSTLVERIESDSEDW